MKRTGLDCKESSWMVNIINSIHRELFSLPKQYFENIDIYQPRMKMQH